MSVSRDGAVQLRVIRCEDVANLGDLKRGTEYLEGDFEAAFYDPTASIYSAQYMVPQEDDQASYNDLDHEYLLMEACNSNRDYASQKEQIWKKVKGKVCSRNRSDADTFL